MRRSVSRVVVLATALTAGIVPTAAAAGIGKQRAAAIAKGAASARVVRFGISYPARTWKADCVRSAGGWRCAVGTGGQCSGVVTVAGTSVRPRVGRVDVSCFG